MVEAAIHLYKVVRVEVPPSFTTITLVLNLSVRPASNLMILLPSAGTDLNRISKQPMVPPHKQHMLLPLLHQLIKSSTPTLVPQTL
jgi:hypothetical protein